MFNIGPLEFLVLVIVGVIVLGPERLPGLVRDAARMLRTLRELANGARAQLRDELGPEFADLNLDELRNLNPRTALSRAILGDENDGLRADLRKLDPRSELRDGLRDLDPRRVLRDDPSDRRHGADDPSDRGHADEYPTSSWDEPVSLDKPVTRPAQRPLERGESAPFDEDAT